MSAIQNRLIFVASLLTAGLAGCDVTVHDCDKEPEAKICLEDDGGDDGFDDDDAGGDDVDGSTSKDSGADASKDAGGSDAKVDGSVRDAGDASSADASPIEPQTVSQFCETQLASAFAWRDSFDVCCVGPRAKSVTDFLSDSIRYVEDAQGVCEMLRNGPIDAKKITYDGNKAAECGTAYAKAYALPPMSCPADGFDLEILEGMIGHGAPALAQIPACRAAFKGNTKQGQTCTDQLECVEGLRCAGESGQKTCQKVVPSSGTCIGNAECADGLTCVGNTAAGGKQCRELATSSGKCAISSECEVGLVCRETGGNPAQCVAAKASTTVCK